MTLQLTDDLAVFTEAVFNLVNNNRDYIGLEDVWFGDQDRSPRTPCAAVEPGPKRRQYKGVPRQYNVEMNAYVLLYVEKIQDSQTNERETLALAERVETVLHADATMNGLVIDSYVSDSDPGYATRGGTLLRASRLTFYGRSQKMLPYTPPTP